MIGELVTITRTRSVPSVPFGQVTHTITYGGVILDDRWEGNALTQIYVSGLRGDGRPVKRWFAVGPDAMRGTITRQTATLDRCGHDVTYGCDCDTIAAEADGQD